MERKKERESGIDMEMNWQHEDLEPESSPITGV